jgi:hypothetical protein
VGAVFVVQLIITQAEHEIRPNSQGSHAPTTLNRVIGQYRVTTDPRSKIGNDPNNGHQ